ncbi:FMN-dependent dehydrogenase-like protein 4 [Elsinoe fawcettii]|nr:FMN-dependent dehydrogenase-like protein 4 [Elsinoe fawcettii]
MFLDTILVLVTNLVAVYAARPFLNEPDTNVSGDIQQVQPGELMNLSRIQGLPDMEYAARTYLNDLSYSRFRSAAEGEWSYRNNMESFQKLRFRPRNMVDITGVENTLRNGHTTILGHRFSLPIFISPCANAALTNPEGAERGLIEGAYASNILYVPSLVTSLPAAELAALKPRNATQVIFQQSYAYGNATANRALFSRFESLGASGIVLTVDSVAGRSQYRGLRSIASVPSARPDSEFVPVTWDALPGLQNLTSLPIVLKGIQTVEDVLLAIEHKVPAIILSNHGGRQLDYAPSAVEVVLEIRKRAPRAFDQIEILADGGVRHGTDVLKLLALGVRAVGLGRPFMFANMWGREGVQRAANILKQEIIDGAGNLGLRDLANIDESFIAEVNWNS